ncbi:MAG: DNA polymerase III subunit delta [Candidatus Ancaeobacter aquaticus]|nr:DNA polymerase III subunit delta [Candidatus Ancaeobacter aquaticus]
MDAVGLKKQVKAQTISSLYVLSGPETLLKNDAFLYLKKHVVTDDLSYEKYNGKETKFSTIVDNASMMPFFGEKKLIYVEEADSILKEVDDLIAYLKEPSPYACIVLCVKNVDKRTKICKELEKKNILIVCNTLYPNQAKEWLSGYVKKNDRYMDSDALDLLLDNVGMMLEDLVSEVDKIMIYAGERKKIVRSDVEALGVSMKTEDVFELTNAIGNKDKKNAIRILIKLLDEGKQAPEIIGLLRWQLVRLFGAGEMMDSGCNQKEIASHYRVHPRYAGGFIENTKQYKKSNKVTQFEALLHADMSFKSGLSDERGALMSLMLSLCR